MTPFELSETTWSFPEGIPNDPLDEIDIPLSLKAVLLRRGITSNADVKEFLNPSYFPDPKIHFPDLNDAIKRISSAHINKEKIAICGDYDADGMTSTALLIKTLTEIGCEAIAAIPNRIEDGYGLNTKMVNDLYIKGIKLLITVDNGVNAIEAIKLAHELKIDIIVTDHHSIKESIPPIIALLHPDTTPSKSPFKVLAGVGIAYILASTLAEHFKSTKALNDSMDLFCIGTIADMSPLTGTNRFLLITGLKNIHKTKCEGLKSLYKLAGIYNRNITSEDIGFQLAPRINAVGRIGNPDLILDLFTETNSVNAMIHARKCDEINRQRKELSKGIEAEAIALLEADNAQVPPFILIAQTHWHPGIVGIVASRIVEKFKRPTALLAGSKDGVFRSSVRAPNGFNVDESLEMCSDLLESFGGHAAAGGFTVKALNISKLSQKLNEIGLDWLKEKGKLLSLKPDCFLELNQIDWQFWKHLEKLGPFGIGNLQPIFWSRKCKVESKKVLRGGHLKLILSQLDCKISAIKWGDNKKTSMPKYIDVAYNINVNIWNDERKLQLSIIAFRECKDVITISKNNRSYNCFIRNNSEVVLQNNMQKEISFSLFPPHDLISGELYRENKYIISLIEDAKIAFGLTH